MTTTNATLWQPTKAVSEYTDDEVEQTPIFQRLMEATKGVLSAKDVLPHARGAIEEMWRKQRAVRYAAPIAALFAAFDGANEQVGDSVVVNRDGSFRPAKKAAASAEAGGRFKNADYARFIGKGTLVDGKPHPKAKHGGFILEQTQARNTNRNGTFELVILAGIKGNKACEDVLVKLYQYPSSGAKAPVIQYPPLKGERADHRKGLNLRVDEDVIEVSSMSNMLKQSLLQMPQTPAQMFGLTEMVRKPGAPAAPASSSDDEDEDEPTVDADEAAANAALDAEFGQDD